jgi:alkanesulfonate monooxygenase SsuD/methylene tetrahydromethanopterin reductase-like flavin-dependent oxidoreductase (luciferase family)
MKFAYMADTHFGVYGQEPAGPEEAAAAFDQLLLEAETAERVGFDGVFLPERHGRTETFIPSPWTVATAIAARTERIKIATTVSLPGLYNPVHLAEQIALIDILSKGRLIFGSGIGFVPDYNRTFGIPWERRVTRTKECLEIIHLALTEDTFSYDGEIFQLEDVTLGIRCYQRPRVPFWVGGFVEKAARRALGYDGWVMWQVPPEGGAEAIEKMRAAAADRGRESFEVVIDQDGWVGEDGAAVRERHAPLWLRETAFYAGYSHPTSEEGASAELGSEEDAGEAVLLDLEQRQWHFGTPESWRERLLGIEADLAPDWVNFRTRVPASETLAAPTLEESLACIEMLGREVVTPLKQGTA